MNKQQIKNLVQKQILETISFKGEIEGTLNKKSLGFNGYVIEKVLEGTVSDVNEYAKQTNLNFHSCEESRFGGYYKGEIDVYDFIPNPKFYGTLMEQTMSAYKSFERISGKNNVILSETNESFVTEQVETIIENSDINEFTIQPIIENISVKRANEMFDPTTFSKFANIIIKDASNKSDSLNELHENDISQISSLVVKYIEESTNKHINKFEYDDESILKNYNKLFVSKNF
jgi:hypothetical protein